MQIPDGHYLFGTVKVGDRGQIVLTKEAREVFHIQPGDTLTVSLDAPGVHRSTEIPLPWEEVTGQA